MKKFAEMVKKTREDKGLSQTDLAKRAKLAQSSINLLEGKKRGVTLQTAFRLSKGLRVSLDYLCSGQGLKRPPKTKIVTDKNKDFLKAFWLMFEACFDLSDEDQNFVQAYVKAKKKS